MFRYSDKAAYNWFTGKYSVPLELEGDCFIRLLGQYIFYKGFSILVLSLLVIFWRPVWSQLRSLRNLSRVRSGQLL